MTTYDLMIKVKTALEENGYEVESAKCSNCKDYEFQAWATKDNKSWRKPVEGYNLTHLFGHRIEFNVVYRSNGTQENVSVDVEIVKWENSRGKQTAKERVNVNMSERQIANRLKKIMDAYEAL